MSRREYDGIIDLSAVERANCYIVEQEGIYKFRTTKGNSYTSVGDVYSVSVLGESFHTTVVPTVGDLISDIYYNDGYVVFTATSNKGNALIAVKNNSGTILGSGHIGLVDYPQTKTYKKYVFMDRHLGAINATMGDLGASGLAYQGGRKDPFLHNDSVIKTTITFPAAVSMNTTTGTVFYSITNPTTFIKSSSNWLYVADSTLGADSKTIYDPSPPGGKLATSSQMSSSGITNAGTQLYSGTYPYLTSNLQSSDNNPLIGYPRYGTIINTNGTLSPSTGLSCGLSNMYSDKGYRLYYSSSGAITYTLCALGLNCRPMKDTSSPIGQE